ncbi:MAG: Phosphomannomutase [Candidatus Uhrbacteria bacterium GW2011_GWA2_52_8d]|uniref:Phosphomannomutase n=1 Tax=Candidatus Uhrbacteria bacterium GW2011_GWA2_52_8d TaxID=1618979 RepID=A0A0G2AKH5_9BACT|nr:MAG: Phosphomannomutase [Candidatus Uhrbacteria bacterium GW2011_GWA2_52_8d]
MKIVVDSANGMGAQYFDELFKLVDADVTRMFWEYDGSFPNHEADPFKEENTEAIRAKVVEVGADLGITTDGDGDRIFFIDDKGHLVTPAVLRGLLAQIVLRDHPGSTICYDIRPGKITRDMIVEAGGIPSVTRVGHSLIKEQMRKEQAVFGGESSGHFFYAFPTGVYEGPVTVATQILQEVTRRGIRLSEIVEPLERYVHSGEINFTVEDKDGMMHKLTQIFSDGELTTLDGITITYPDFWFNVRGSNTESKLRLNLEAIDRKTMESRRDEIVAVIKEGA